MSKIVNHPVLEVPVREKVTFRYNGKEIQAESGYTIAAALHQAGFPVHSHSLEGRSARLPVALENVVPVRCWWTGRSGVFVSRKLTE